MIAAWLALVACGGRCEPGRICVLAGTGDLGFDGDGKDARDTRLAAPTAVGVDPDGRVFVVDSSNMRVRRIEEDGTVATIAGNGYHAGSEFGARATESSLENPIDAVYGPDGDLYLVLHHEGRLVRIEDGVITPFCGTGVVGDTGDGGEAVEAEMGYGAGVALAEDGSVYVSDLTWSRVRRVGPDGIIDTVLGTGTAGTGVPGYGPEMAIRSPERLALDEERGRLVVADTGNQRVLALDLETLDTVVLAGPAERRHAGDAPSLDADLDGPVGVAITPNGDVLVADLGNDVIRLVDGDGEVHVVAGASGLEPSRKADPLEFAMTGPAGMAWTPDGDLLVAERGGHRVLLWAGAADEL